MQDEVLYYCILYEGGTIPVLQYHWYCIFLAITCHRQIKDANTFQHRNSFVLT